MRKIFIGAGHSNVKGKDRGASGNGYIEGELNVGFRDKLVAELKKLGINPTVDGNDTVFWQTIKKFKTLVDPTSIVVDIHFNAATPAATGTETLIPAVHTQFERDLAGEVSNIISDTLGIPMRGRNGVKTEADSHHGRLGWMRLKGENILLEICFITNPNDMSSYCEKENELAEKIAAVLHKYAQKEGSKVKNEYVVQPGDYLSRIALKTGTTVKKLIEINRLESNVIHPGQVLKTRV